MAEARRLTELIGRIELATDVPDGPLVVALSGGADSAALAYLLARHGAELRSVHVHHGLPASDRLAGAAAAIADRLGLDLHVERVDVPPGASPEARARAVRYRALEEGLAADEWLLTAHTADDQAETVLHRLLRGAGARGLSGIPPRRERIVRPFLDVTRSETRELATLAGLPWIDDPSNADISILRNHIRRRLLPELEATYNPALRRTLAETARLVATDAAFIDAHADPPPRRGPDGPELAAAVITSAHPAVATRLARALLHDAGVADVDARTVDAVVEVAQGRRPRFDAGGGIEVRRRGAMVVAAGRERLRPAPAILAVPGTTAFGPWLVDVEATDRAPAAMPLGAHWMVADADALGDLRVEPAAEHPELLELLADGGVAAEDRPSHPVVVAAAGPVWLPGVRRLPIGWVEAETRRYLVASIRLSRSWLRSEP